MRTWLWMSVVFAAVSTARSDSDLVKVATGEELVQMMRSAAPAADETLNATLKRRGGRKPRIRRTVTVETRLQADGWTVCYRVDGDGAAAAETACVRRGGGGKPVYSTDDGQNWRTAADLPGPVSVGEGSFLLTDFGMEFLFWPEHRLVDTKIKMSRGRPCYTLESLNPSPGADGYARVVSRVDREHLGLIHADVYDGENRLIKQFEPEGVVKVGDVYRLDALRMVDRRTREVTTIEFRYD